MKKYGPLYDYLNTCGKTSLRLTFDEIEKIIDDTLPKSALNHRPWWANQRSGDRPQADAWLSASYKVSSLNQSEKWVEFTKE